MISLDERLAACASLVRLDKRICDVGTDHALLPCRLWQLGARDIVACDINEGPLKSAAETIGKTGCGGIRLIRSDGLKNVPECDDIVIAGMGGELIADIIGGCPFVTPEKRFILQPMTKAEVLRRRLYASGFEIELEKGACCAGKAYTVILARYCGKKTDIGGDLAFFGKCADERYIERVNARLEKMGRADPYYLTLIR